ncbi:MAG: hypothetical protein AAF762_04895 [Pseudomonadota bacterium]
MDDFSRLEQKLAKLRQRDRAPGEPRVLRGSPDRLLASILLEIDETILPRRLSFSTEGGETLHFAVGNRRLQALVAPQPAVQGAEAVANVALKSVEDDAVPALKSVVQAVISRREVLIVSSARFADLSPPSDVGVPVDQLAKAWGVELPSGGGDPAAGLAGFVEGLNGRVAGWLRIDGETVAAQGGAEDVVASLTDSAGVFLDGYYGRRDTLKGSSSGPLGMVFTASDGRAVVFIDAGEAMVFARADAATAYGIARDWQQVTAL